MATGTGSKRIALFSWAGKYFSIEAQSQGKVPIRKNKKLTKLAQKHADIIPEYWVYISLKLPWAGSKKVLSPWLCVPYACLGVVSMDLCVWACIVFGQTILDYL